ncbi:MAG: prepilin peptidase [Candidatus Bathyarchaeota archaeon]|nr:prepilin peptidase [Candidatus Bathyarchaeota archaeon]
MVNGLIDSLRLSLCLMFLSIASIYDLKFREIPDIIWIISSPIGLALSVISLALSAPNQVSDIIIWIATVAIVSGLSLTLFYLGLWGGADAKALICLSLSMPTRLKIRFINPVLERHSQYVFPLPMPISTLNNSVLAAALLTAAISLRNLIDLARSGGRIFEGLEETGFLRKTLAFITGYRVEAEKLRSGKHHYIIMEEFSLKGDGTLKRSLKILHVLGAEGEVESKIPEGINGKIWVTPALPFLLFIEIGFITTIFIGDVIFWLAFNFLKLV